MLDTEMEYIDYLRIEEVLHNDKRPQQRVLVGGRKKDRDADGGDTVVQVVYPEIEDLKKEETKV